MRNKVVLDEYEPLPIICTKSVELLTMPHWWAISRVSPREQARLVLPHGMMVTEWIWTAILALRPAQRVCRESP